MELKEANIDTCGTLRLNRGEPAALRDRAKAKGAEKMQKGEVVAKDNGTVCVVYWQDKRCVKTISTIHDASMGVARVRQRGGGGGRVNIEKPNMVISYNQYMSGVDRVDQMLSYYPTVRRTIKWVKKLFFWYLMLSLNNACVIYNH